MLRSPLRWSRPWRLGAGLLVLAALWSAGWHAAAALAARGLDDWIATESADGRQWTCPDRQVEGYPLALRLRCTRPTFRGELAGHIAAGLVEGLSAGVTIAHPGTLALAIASPLNLRAEDDTFAVEISWADLDLTLPIVFGPPSGGAVAASRLAVSLSAPTEGDLNLRAAHLSGEADAVPAAPADKRFAFTAQGVSFPTLDAVPGLEAPAEAEGRGVLAGAALLTAPTIARLEAWRHAGGALRLDSLSVAKGPFSGSARGTLGLDAGHRPAGRLDTSLAGFGPIAEHFGIPVAGVQLGGLLTDLLGGGKSATAPKGTVQLPLIFADGRLSIGPFPTGARLAPLY